MQNDSRTPLATARTVQAIVALQEWTPDGLARGVVQGDADPALPDGTMVNVLGGIPGETVEVTAYWPAIWNKRQLRHPRPPLVRLARVIQSAPQRQAAPCPVFGDCGGCRLQHLSYPDQLVWKRDRVQAEFAARRLPADRVQPPLGMKTPWGFRNQMRFAVNRAGQPGLTALGTHRVIPLVSCPIAHPLINQTLAAIAPVVNPRPQVLVRCGAATGEILVQPAPSGSVAEAFIDAGIAIHTENLHEQLHGMSFAMRPSSFFQTNTAQAEVMADLVLTHAVTAPDAIVVDAYCGVGTFAALLAQRAARVIAIEESASAVHDAHENLHALNLDDRVQVLQGRTEDLLPALPDDIACLVLDPPRLGCQPPVLAAICTRQIPRVVYISCDPPSLARDLAVLCDGGYSVTLAQPLDMFPQTHHIECVAVLDFRGN